MASISLPIDINDFLWQNVHYINPELIYIFLFFGQLKYNLIKWMHMFHVYETETMGLLQSLHFLLNMKSVECVVKIV